MRTAYQILVDKMRLFESLGLKPTDPPERFRELLGPLGSELGTPVESSEEV